MAWGCLLLKSLMWGIINFWNPKLSKLSHIFYTMLSYESSGILSKLVWFLNQTGLLFPIFPNFPLGLIKKKNQNHFLSIFTCLVIDITFLVVSTLRQTSIWGRGGNERERFITQYFPGCSCLLPSRQNIWTVGRNLKISF